MGGEGNVVLDAAGRKKGNVDCVTARFSAHSLAPAPLMQREPLATTASKGVIGRREEEEQRPSASSPASVHSSFLRQRIVNMLTNSPDFGLTARTKGRNEGALPGSGSQKEKMRRKWATRGVKRGHKSAKWLRFSSAQLRPGRAGPERVRREGGAVSKSFDYERAWHPLKASVHRAGQ